MERSYVGSRGIQRRGKDLASTYVLHSRPKNQVSLFQGAEVGRSVRAVEAVIKTK